MASSWRVEVPLVTIDKEIRPVTVSTAYNTVVLPAMSLLWESVLWPSYFVLFDYHIDLLCFLSSRVSLCSHWVWSMMHFDVALCGLCLSHLVCHVYRRFQYPLGLDICLGTFFKRWYLERTAYSVLFLNSFVDRGLSLSLKLIFITESKSTNIPFDHVNLDVFHWCSRSQRHCVCLLSARDLRLSTTVCWNSIVSLYNLLWLGL